MLCRVLLRGGPTPVAIVRRDAQRDSLRALGVEHVLVSGGADFERELRDVARGLGATLALDAVGGETTGALLRAMPDHSWVRVYGMLSGAPCAVDPSELVFHDKRLCGFTMYEWLRTTGMLSQLLAVVRVQGLLHDVLRTEVRERVSLEASSRALALAAEGGSDGKVLLVP